MQNKQFSEILNTRGFSSVSRHSYHSKQCRFFQKNIFHHQQAETKTSKKISTHIKSIADMYNSLYENKMKDNFKNGEKRNETGDKSRPRKKSEGKFVIRLWNPEETFFSKTLRN